VSGDSVNYFHKNPELIIRVVLYNCLVKPFNSLVELFINPFNTLFKFTTLCVLYQAWGRKRRVESVRGAVK